MTNSFFDMNNYLSFFIFIGFVIFVRVVELLVSKRNELWLRQNGAVEYGQKHYPYIVALHSLFIASMIIEFLAKPSSGFNLIFLIAFILLILFKTWTISSLGKYWNTKILRVPNSVFIKKGPYKYFRHPNYFIVICEIIVIPMVYGLYYTAIIFTILNGIMLMVRIKEEEKVWE